MKLLNKIVNKFGYTLTSNKPSIPPDILADQAFIEIFNQCRPFTMTSPERLFSLYQSVKYLEENNIQGDFVECGVWKGGSCMLMALTLLKFKNTSRKIFLYDTFEGMSAPTSNDTVAGDGRLASELLSSSDKNDPNSVWCYSTLDEVRANISKIGYPSSNLKLIKGKVEDTIPGEIPASIALLRLDTDWYESTYHELTHLYDLLVKNGVLIIDDFGFWEGAKKAVLQFFNERNLRPIINRIDDTGRIIIKTEI
ncbi:TylF/MycF/NovP-related O-methyltransferase [Pollutibacter soli]|uniref:TylF/MycF/NovP-related O-methyltransferase n=1 Tax=Pollutibacter soli TaxID=3034157 RepID=UPI00301352E5